MCVRTCARMYVYVCVLICRYVFVTPECVPRTHDCCDGLESVQVQLSGGSRQEGMGSCGQYYRPKLLVTPLRPLVATLRPFLASLRTLLTPVSLLVLLGPMWPLLGPFWPLLAPLRPILVLIGPLWPLCGPFWFS